MTVKFLNAGVIIGIHREIMLAALEFRHPDKIPVIYNPSADGLHVRSKKLLDLYNEFPPDNQITLASIPESAPGIVAPDGGYHELKTDEWNIEWEFRIFGYIESLLFF